MIFFSPIIKSKTNRLGLHQKAPVIRKIQREINPYVKSSDKENIFLWCYCYFACHLVGQTPYRVWGKGVTYSWEMEASFEIVRVRFLNLYDRWQHHPSPLQQFWYVSEKGGGNFSWNNTYGTLLATDHRNFRTTDFTSTYTTCSRWVFGNIWNRMQAFRFEVSYLKVWNMKKKQCFEIFNIIFNSDIF